ncbi:transposase [Streptomyces acidicola]|uniref:transposase n=1 Tax=Streptomyces acidicola TaxID=2596892 RepID=UPI00389AA7A6
MAAIASLTASAPRPVGVHLNTALSNDRVPIEPGTVHWLTLERLPAYVPELNPVELLWSSLKKRDLATSPATTSRMSPTPLNKASTASTTTSNCRGPSSTTPASPSTHYTHRTYEKISRGR